jgi:hypothetical protein
VLLLAVAGVFLEGFAVAEVEAAAVGGVGEAEAAEAGASSLGNISKYILPVPLSSLAALTLF